MSYTGALLISLVILANVNYAFAKTDDNQSSTIDNQFQLFTNSWRLVKHSFQLHIPKNDKPLSQLIIETPSTVAVSSDIEVIDTTGQKVDINISTNGKQIIIDFPDKVIQNTKLLVNLNRVQQPTSGAASVYKLSAKVVGSDTEIPMGVATFKTF
ncbi:DUF2808 domain-containing protein [Dulcicalothrix desertica]|uniref:DUF2808 domain-containing protein n=1 Tax=Dulcicalothrix desertica TaxID=32056 RepID=UPI00398990A4